MTLSECSETKPRRARGRPTLEDVAVIERELLAVALAEFLKQGYGATSMRKIAQAAQVSKTTLYAKYPSKEELFRAIMREQIAHIDGALSLQIHSARPDIEAGLIAYANLMLESSMQGDMLEVNRLIYSEANRFPELGTAAAERTAMGVRQIADFVRLCAKVDAIPCRDPEAVAEAFILMIRGWYVNEMLTDQVVGASQRESWVKRAVHVLLCARADW